MRKLRFKRGRDEPKASLMKEAWALESRSSCSKTHLPAKTSPHLSLGPNLSVPEDEDSRRAHLSNLSRTQAWISVMVVEGVASWCHFQLWFNIHYGSFPGGSDSKQPVCNAGDPGSIPGWGRSLEKQMATHSSILAWRIP